MPRVPLLTTLGKIDVGNLDELQHPSTPKKLKSKNNALVNRIDSKDFFFINKNT